VTYLFSAASTQPARNPRPPELNLASQQCTQVMPSSPVSHDQPPTPEHPPPSPTTAMIGIQQKLNPSPKVHDMPVSCWMCPEQFVVVLLSAVFMYWEDHIMSYVLTITLN